MKTIQNLHLGNSSGACAAPCPGGAPFPFSLEEESATAFSLSAASEWKECAECDVVGDPLETGLES
jgi:hypothetical protein